MKYHVQSVRNQAYHALETLEMIEKVEWPQNVEKMAWPWTTLRCSFWSFEFSAPKKGCCQFTSATVLVPSHHTKIIRAKIQRIGTQESIRFCPGIIDRLHLCRWWWQFMLMTILICWWLFFNIGSHHQNDSVIKILKLSPLWSHQHPNWLDRQGIPTVNSLLATSMLVTDVGDEMYRWQLWNVGDGFGHLWFSSPLVVFVPSIF